MPSTLKMLIVTTEADFSLSLFYAPESMRLIAPEHLMYGSDSQTLEGTLKKDFDFIYFRDPFNEATPHSQIKKTTDLILNRYKKAYKVDAIASYKDMLLEDKWEQYRLLPEFMPPTKIMEKIPDGLDNKIVKKRISARSKGIIFRQEDFPDNAKPEDYIIQPKLDIQTEYRIYMVGGRVIKPTAIKSSKTILHKVKITGVENDIEPEIMDICKGVYNTTNYDLMGLDIAKTKNGFKLLEVNRSCQFKGYLRVSGKNLAVNLSEYLLDLTKL